MIRPARIERVRGAFERAASSFDAHSAVFDVAGDRLLERLEVLAMSPLRILDLGCRTGRLSARLAERYPEARIVGADPAPGRAVPVPSSWPRWLRPRRPNADGARIAADPHRLPFADASFDLVVSNLLLPWCHAPRRVFAECARVLDTGGAYFFCSAGPDTLAEYRRVWAGVDAHLHEFGLLDMHDVGDAMLASGFAAPVLDRDDMKVDFPTLAALETELRAVGAVNLANGRRRGLTAPSVRRALEAGVDPRARFPVTLELVQGHGWKGELGRASGGSRGAAGEAVVSLENLRDSLKR